MKEVVLRLIEDEDETVGYVPQKTWNQDVEFNAFYNALGIFHDVFEHSHEGEKYFRGSAFMNVGGEIAAMGYAVRVYELVGSLRSFNPRNDFINDIAHTVTAILEDNYFGSKVISHVPNIPPIDNRNLESTINEIWDTYNEIKDTYCDVSMELTDLENLMRYGYNKALEELGDSSGVVEDFILFFKNFVSSIDAKFLLNFDYNYLTIRFDRTGWEGELSSGSGASDIKLTDVDTIEEDVYNAY